MRPGPTLALLLLLVPALGPAPRGDRGGAAYLYPDMPPPAHTGGFGEPTCHACHWGSDLNEPRGSLELDGLPRGFEPGATYKLRIDLRHPELERAGFQLSVRFAEGPDHGRDAGSLEPAPGTEVVPFGEDPVVEYLQQTLEGTEVESAGAAAWSFQWTAPEEAAHPVVFHLAANAANYDLSDVGDYIYTLERSVAPEARRR